MKLNHLNLTVTDVPKATEFLEKYFGMRNMGGNKGMAFLTDEPTGLGFILSLMKAGASKPCTYPETFHIGFFIASRKAVDELNQRLKGDGVDVPPAADTGHSYGFYVAAPGGFTVEVGSQ